MKRTELLSALEKIKPGIASRGIVESMTYYFFSGKEVVTYNDKISIQYPLETSFSLFVKASDLLKIVSKSTSDTISLVEKGNKLNIKSAKLKASLATIKDEEITSRIANVNKSIEEVKWKKLPDNFSECISLCFFAASKVESDQTLTCLHIDKKDCCASDNMRIAYAVFNSPMDNMLLKASEVGNLISINPTSYAISKAWLHFKNEDGCIFSIRQVNGFFPEVLELFKFEGTKIKLPQSITEGIDMASIFADDIQPSIDVKISNNICIISVKSDGGSLAYRSKIKYSGDDVTFVVNPQFLMEMMKHSTSITVCEDKAKLETENFSLITALYA